MVILRPNPASSVDEVTMGGPGDRDTTTTTCTSEEDVTHYHAYTQTGTSDSEQGGSGSRWVTRSIGCLLSSHIFYLSWMPDHI